MFVIILSLTFLLIKVLNNFFFNLSACNSVCVES